MKYYRKWQRFRRRHQQYIFIIILGLFTIFICIFLLLNEDSNVDDVLPTELSIDCHCSKSSLVVINHGECFFDELVCHPGFTGDRCNKQIKNETYRSHCPFDTHRTQWTRSYIHELKIQCLKSQSAQQEWNTSCLFLCFYHRLTGIIQVPQIFWYKSLKNELDYWKDNPMTLEDRLYEHIEGFHGYKTIPLEIPSIIEIGAGPFTQVQYLLTPFRSVKKITLVEPNALDYMKLNNCAYRGGHLRGHPVTILAESIEVLMKKRREKQLQLNSTQYYSILISMNVVEHVSDALEYFRGLYDLLEDNGLLIFHERWYDYPQQGDCLLDTAENLHPIRITKWIIEKFLNQFETIFINFNKTTRQIRSKCFEQGIHNMFSPYSYYPQGFQQTNSNPPVTNNNNQMIVSGTLRTPGKPSQNSMCSDTNCTSSR